MKCGSGIARSLRNGDGRVAADGSKRTGTAEDARAHLLRPGAMIETRAAPCSPCFATSRIRKARRVAGRFLC